MTGLNEEIQEDDLQDAFADYGEVKRCTLNVDRRTGYVKGYALLEYEQLEEAKKAISKLDSSELAGRQIQVDWAFKKPPSSSRR